MASTRAKTARYRAAQTEAVRTGLPILALLAVTAAALLLLGCSTMQRGYEAALVLGDLSAGERESRLKARTPEPLREELDYVVAGREYVADIYRGADSRRGTLVLVHGFTEDGRRDPRLVAFAHTLARAGFVVLVPELDGLRDLSISTREAQAIADAVRFATGAEAPTAAHHTAIAAVSFAVGPALLAAMEADTREQVSFVIGVGGYYDLVDMLRYVTTGEDRGGAGRGAPPPQREGRWAILLSQTHWLDDEEDREALEIIARRRMADGTASVGDQLRRLSREGRAVYALVMNRDPDRVEGLLEQLPPRLRAELAALNLSARDLDALRARLVLIHGPDDRVIPVSHSRRLTEALPAGQARLFEASGLGHVDVSPGLRDGFGLWRAAVYVLALGERQGEGFGVPGAHHPRDGTRH